MAEIIKTRFTGKKILIACGCGNNGGDGFAAANNLKNMDVTVMLLRPPESIRSPEALEFFKKVTCHVFEYPSSTDLEEYDVLVDCALGTGLKGPVKEPYLSYIKTANRFKGTIISADVPSGFGSGMIVRPDITVAFHDIKDGMTAENSGEIIIANIGIPEEAYSRIGPGDMMRYPIPEDNSHKGCNGTLLVIGGGPYCGAPAMAAMAAMRVGSDLVRIATPSASAKSVASFSPVFVMDEMRGEVLGPGHVKKLIELSDMCNAVLIGPGLGIDELTVDAVNEFVKNCKRPIVIDADGLNALGKTFHSNGSPTILTPHSREFLRLGGTIGNDPAAHVSIKATETDSIILMKGPNDIVSNGKDIRINNTGNSAMTSAGTGDVLAGIVAGLLSKGMDAFDAACLGAYISGRAGDLAFEEKSYGLIAIDIIEMIPRVLKKELK